MKGEREREGGRRIFLSLSLFSSFIFLVNAQWSKESEREREN
jgi:hypothetical protein